MSFKGSEPTKNKDLLLASINGQSGSTLYVALKSRLSSSSLGKLMNDHCSNERISSTFPDGDYTYSFSSVKASLQMDTQSAKVDGSSLFNALEGTITGQDNASCPAVGPASVAGSTFISAEFASNLLSYVAENNEDWQ